MHVFSPKYLVTTVKLQKNTKFQKLNHFSKLHVATVGYLFFISNFRLCTKTDKFLFFFCRIQLPSAPTILKVREERIISRNLRHILCIVSNRTVQIFSMFKLNKETLSQLGLAFMSLRVGLQNRKPSVDLLERQNLMYLAGVDILQQ